LHEASSHNGNLEIVKLLIEKGANINAKDLDGLTPRDYALKNGHKEIAKYIEERQ
jgi:ankyrin repeat protein